MMIDSKLLDEEESHALLKSCVVPRPVAWISTRSLQGVANLAPYSCFTFVATSPPMIAFSVGRRTNGDMKDTLRNIRETSEFVVHIVSDEYGPAVTRTAADVPPDQSEWNLVSIKATPSDRVRPARIESSPVSMECRLHHAIELGESMHTLIIGEVLLFHIDDAVFRGGIVDVQKLRPLCRLAGDQFAKLGDTFEVKRMEIES